MLGRIRVLWKLSLLLRDVAMERHVIGCRGTKRPLPIGFSDGVKLPRASAGGGIKRGKKPWPPVVAGEANHGPQGRIRPVALQVQTITDTGNADDDLAVESKRCHVGPHSRGTGGGMAAQRIIERQLVSLF